MEIIDLTGEQDSDCSSEPVLSLSKRKHDMEEGERVKKKEKKKKNLSDSQQDENANINHGGKGGRGKTIWTTEEEELLRHLVKEHGRSWIRVAKHFENKGPDCVKAKYDRLTGKKKDSRWVLPTVNEYNRPPPKEGKEECIQNLINLVPKLESKNYEIASFPNMKEGTNGRGITVSVRKGTL
jgi:hypothetical protein